MLASLAARAYTTVTSPFKPSPSPAPPPPPLADPASPSPSTRSPPSGTHSAHSLDSPTTDKIAQDASDLTAAVDSRPVSPSPAAASAPAPDAMDLEDDDDEPSTFAAERTRTTRAGRADADAPDTDDPALGPDGKPYLVAGLYWSSALPPRTRDTPSSSSSSSAPTDWRKVTPTRGTALPPPVYHGETLVDDERAFRLPFDILRDCYYAPEAASRAGKGKGRKGRGRGGADEADAATTKREGKGGDKTTAADIAKREMSKKPEPYRHIGKNVYVDRKPDKAELPAICMCTLPARSTDMGCGQGCINRLMQYCCDPKKCPCGPDRCANVPLNKREGVPEGKDGLRVIWTGNRGFGLKTMVDIKEGDFVIEYRGEVISRDESYRRVLTTYKDQGSYYFMDYDGFEVIDAGQRGNSARFINHSCGPNLQVVRWRLATVEEYQMGLFALHDIPAGTELTYDYGWQDFSTLAAPTFAAAPAAAADGTEGGGTIALSTSTAIDPARQRCYCGASACSGFLGGRKRADAKAKKAAAAAAATTTSRGAAKGRASAANKRKRDDDDDDDDEGEGDDVDERPSKRPVFAQARVVLPTSTVLARVQADAAPGAGAGAGGLKRSGSGRKAAREALGKLLR
ncbi:uncharacterized protein RHOBADRAFT_56389 [Rhodotorula graminis WP1]|uniref:SET domain-containing protein n=1 Tax=Rhodotorula graminis (strain WP1) TaxID=578459 RepID=A0A0P9EJD2_RHOGW|nr:uncharacterized protein RHOBADRAFT_56389 [Rhodotorula graminis WP1]KPV71769.1 hypothetical protein RHOBADRAFT_56389 [Rhodotorula graminis WP1]